jgi:hypothetical protein
MPVRRAESQPQAPVYQLQVMLKGWHARWPKARGSRHERLSPSSGGVWEDLFARAPWAW